MASSGAFKMVRQPIHSHRRAFKQDSCRKVPKLRTILKLAASRRRRIFLLEIAALDDDSFGESSFIDNGESSLVDTSYFLSSSEGEESDGDLLVNYTDDIDLPTAKGRTQSSDTALIVAAHRFATIQKRRRWKRIWKGVLINSGLLIFLAFFLLFVDWWAWRVVRVPLEPFFLSHPFTISTVFSVLIGCVFVPILDKIGVHQILGKRSFTHISQSATPTMGGLLFVPVGLVIALRMVGQHSVHVLGATRVTIAFAAIGFASDMLSHIRKCNFGLPGWIKVFLTVAAGTWFSIWLDSTYISTPYNMKLLIPLPPPVGLLYLGKFYLLLSTFCFAFMANGVSLTEGLDGLAGGICALGFVGMAVAVLPISPELAVFGSSMSGACIGFLFHNHYRASVFMGETGALALGGALAAMAACTGMFFPLLISSGVIILEVLSVLVQVPSLIIPKHIHLAARRIFRIAPLHRHLHLWGVKKPVIVAIATVLSGIFSLYAGYVGLISA